MKKFVFPLALAIASAFAVDVQAILLVDSTNGASSVGNGAFFSDPTGTVAPAGVSVNGAGPINTNGNGRALAGMNQTDTINFTSLTDITENRGVEIDGWGTYRWNYIGGNDAGGFLENGGRLGKPNAANDGQAFSNSGPFIVVSDQLSHGTLGAADNVFSLSFLTGTDTANADFDVETFLVFDDTTFTSINDSNIDSTAETVTVTGTTGTSFSTLRLVFAFDTGNGERALMDDVQFTVAVPEASSFLAVGMVASLVGLRRKRS